MRPLQTTYQELTISMDDKFVDFISDFVANIYNDGLEIGEGKIIVRSENSVTYIADALEVLAGTLGDSLALSCVVAEKENSDWIQSYKDSVQPIEAGKFYIHPSWNEPMKDKLNITVDPALAFGSGHHATTSSCLVAIGEYVGHGDTLVDIGCGSGILGLAARKLGAIVELCDTDPVSVQSSKENFKLNNEEYQAIWEGSINKTDKKYDIVIANIIADVLRAISTPLQNAISDDGILIISGILDKKESIVSDAYSELTLIERKQKDEWITLIYKKEIND